MLENLIKKYEDYKNDCDPFCCAEYLIEVIEDLKSLQSNKHTEEYQWPTPEEMAKMSVDLQVEIQKLPTQNPK